MSMRKQLITLIILPLVGLFVLGVIVGVSGFGRYQSAQATEINVDHVLDLGTFVHAMQLERGQSAGFLASEGRNFADVLPQTREQTDLAVQAKDLTAFNPELGKRLTELAQMREAVTSQTLGVPDMARWYTGTIRMALHEAEGLLVHQSDPEITRLGGGLVALAEAKEAAGLERAAGATGLGAGVFTTRQYAAFLGRGAVESRLLEVAATSLDKRLDPQVLEAQARDSGVTEYRERITALGPNAATDGMSAAEWFARSTLWIDALRAIEERLVDEMLALSAAQSATALWILALSVLLNVAVIAICVLYSMRVLRNSTGQFMALERAMGRLARKDYDGRSYEQDLSTEVGRLFASIDATRCALREADEQMEVAAETRQAVLNSMEAALGELSRGDLTFEINDAFPPEYERLRLRYNEAISQSRETFVILRNHVRTFEDMSRAMRSEADKMSQRTGSQAASLEQTTAALTEMTHGVAEAAEHAADTFKLTATLRQTSDDGQQRMGETLDVMREIATSAEQMNSMLTMIDDIAFQTNLLALNAGVEAARAGESGRGFAVVAGEVRQLAGRASETAKEIKTIIQTTGGSISHGVSLVETAVKAFDAINDGVQTTTGSVERISQGATAQATTISEIQSAMRSLDEVTQGNAAMTHETSEQAAVLERRAGDVKTLVDSFTLEKDTFPSAVPHAA